MARNVVAINGVEVEVGSGDVVFWNEGTLECVRFPVGTWPEVKETVDLLLGVARDGEDEPIVPES